MDSSVFTNAKRASRALLSVTPDATAALLRDLADRIVASTDSLLAANAKDLARMDPASPLYDRLKLTAERLSGIAGDMRNVASLPCPVGRILEERTLPNGLRLSKTAVPFGVIGVVFEARPNVCFDVFSLCLRAGSACILKGGSDAQCSNEAAVALMRATLADHGLDPCTATLLPAGHEATAELLAARGFVDLLIPRGGAKLISFVRENARVPVIETGAGVCHAYFDRAGDLEKGRAIVCNAKTRRTSVCNALDTLLVHAERLSDLPALCAPLAEKGVEIHADPRAFGALRGAYPDALLVPAGADDFGREWLSLRMSLRTVDSIDEALDHVAANGSGHSECIVSEDEAACARFIRDVDAACVYTNAPTSFTDGAQFGLGAEIGISTQKLHARGPMALAEITTYKWVVRGNGQIRAGS